jgi:hypothetical protein
MASPLVRRAQNATNSLHSLIYFAPEAEQRFTDLGLKAGRMTYFAGRAAPMGAVGSGVVTATFYNFSPTLIERCIPEAWAIASPSAIIAARFAAVDDALTRLLGPDILASAELATFTRLTREAASACTPQGRPLYAGHADLDWPGTPLLDMWHAVSLLREYRGDGHIAALTASGLSGLEALVTHTATGKGFLPEFARTSRGWSDGQWDLAVSGLTERGLLDGDGALTAAGEELRGQVERETDRMATPPWAHLGDQDTEEVVRIGSELTKAVVAAGAFPAAGVFAPR